MAFSEEIDALSQAAVARFRADVQRVIMRLRTYLKNQLADANRDEKGRLVSDDFNAELAAKLEARLSGVLKDLGYDGAIGRLLDTFEEVQAANNAYLADRLGESFSGVSRKALAKFADGTVDDLLLVKGEAGARLREVLLHGATSNAPITDLLEELSVAAEVPLNRAIMLAQTMLMGFHRESLATESESAGIDLYVYEGPDDGIVRDFCSLYVGRVVTLPDLDAAQNGEHQPKPVSRFLGGWRCRHSLAPISLEEAQGMVESGGERAIGPGCRLARKILLQGKEGPAAKAWRVANAGRVVNGRVVRRAAG